MSKTAITLGDPCSIGAEITKKALLELNLDLSKFVLIGNKTVFGEIPFDVEFIDIKTNEKLEIGEPSKQSGEVAFKSIEKAIELAKSGKIKAIVTAPISKYALHLAGQNFSGHTEIFEKHLGQNAQMLFITGGLKVLLLTRHISLADVPATLTQKFIEEEIQKLNSALQKLGVKKPKIALCGLNPHAGEGGLLGKEEQEQFLPAIKNLQAQSINIEGPFAADMLFAKASDFYKKNVPQPYDCYVAAYHDQGLCAVKSIDLGKTVNVTIGLDVLRTSPAHGTAFDIAGKNIASPESMKEAIKFAFEKIY
jgi:4-hydroxythreonine-4-phosphate dehydrogenase